MIKCKWLGDPLCCFCSDNENIHHLFFRCSAAKYVWSIVSRCLGDEDRLEYFSQYFWWIPNFLPHSRNLKIVGLTALCCAIWKLRNITRLDNKLVRSPIEFICYDVSFM